MNRRDIERLDNFYAQPPLQVMQGPGGIGICYNAPGFYAQLTSGGSSSSSSSSSSSGAARPGYSYVEVQRTVDGSAVWEVLDGGRTGDLAYEINDQPATAGTVVWLEPEGSDEAYVFQLGGGSGGPPPTIPSAYNTVQNNGANLPQRTTLDFIGFASVADDAANNRTKITAPGYTVYPNQSYCAYASSAYQTVPANGNYTLSGSWANRSPYTISGGTSLAWSNGFDMGSPAGSNVRAIFSGGPFPFLITANVLFGSGTPDLTGTIRCAQLLINTSAVCGNSLTIISPLGGSSVTTGSYYNNVSFSWMTPLALNDRISIGVYHDATTANFAVGAFLVVRQLEQTSWY